jgi:hypothetical protein
MGMYLKIQCVLLGWILMGVVGGVHAHLHEVGGDDTDFIQEHPTTSQTLEFVRNVPVEIHGLVQTVCWLLVAASQTLIWRRLHLQKQLTEKTSFNPDVYRVMVPIQDALAPNTSHLES